MINNIDLDTPFSYELFECGGPRLQTINGVFVTQISKFGDICNASVQTKYNEV